MSGNEMSKLINCITLLKQDGSNTKQKVQKIIQKLIDDHNKKWGK